MENAEPVEKLRIGSRWKTRSRWRSSGSGVGGKRGAGGTARDRESVEGRGVGSIQLAVGSLRAGVCHPPGSAGGSSLSEGRARLDRGTASFRDRQTTDVWACSVGAHANTYGRSFFTSCTSPSPQTANCQLEPFRYYFYGCSARRSDTKSISGAPAPPLSRYRYTSPP